MNPSFLITCAKHLDMLKEIFWSFLYRDEFFPIDCCNSLILSMGAIIVLVTPPAIAPLKKESAKLGWLSPETPMPLRDFELFWEGYILVFFY